MNIEVHVSFQLVFSFSLTIYSGVELLDHIVLLFAEGWKAGREPLYCLPQ